MHTDAIQPGLTRSAEEVRRAFEVRGLSIAAWARAHGYSSQLVYQILAGRKPCLRGQSHRIAVHLGLKRGLIGSLQDLEPQAQVVVPESPAADLRPEAEPMS
ncbi:MAG TPA: DNA-binding protein [Acidobacteriaceae bacterium]|nr:DNA-binding protein [Acidobacteriaceae bacterium]